MIVLGLETSCDETAAAVIRTEKNHISVLSNVVSSQVKLHAQWGGVVPNLAAREHLKNILPVIEESLIRAKINSQKIDLISVTQGPGLIPALLIGVSTAKTLSYLWKKPLIGIHHIEGHIYANFIDSPHPTLSLRRRGTKGEVKKMSFPVLCLVVSGGHTQLVLMKKHLDYKIIGETLDDAAGEAFDKVARILNLGYPGGPAISAQAEIAESRIMNYESRNKKGNKPIIHDSRFIIHLPRPMINSKNFNFSFSGLKTAVLYLAKKNKKRMKDKNFTAAVCREFQQAVIDVLIDKTITAALKYKPKTILLAGGVSANQELRKQLNRAIKNRLPYILYRMPNIKYCLDNASMIAVAGFYRREKLNDNWKNMEAFANLKLKKCSD